MATSSILENVKIKEPSAIAAFIEALEASEQDPPQDFSTRTYEHITDPDEIRQFLKKRYLSDD